VHGEQPGLFDEMHQRRKMAPFPNIVVIQKAKKTRRHKTRGDISQMGNAVIGVAFLAAPGTFEIADNQLNMRWRGKIDGQLRAIIPDDQESDGMREILPTNTLHGLAKLATTTGHNDHGDLAAWDRLQRS
jgi:hypothetical protein